MKESSNKLRKYNSNIKQKNFFFKNNFIFKHFPKEVL